MSWSFSLGSPCHNLCRQVAGTKGKDEGSLIFPAGPSPWTTSSFGRPHTKQSVQSGKDLFISVNRGCQELTNTFLGRKDWLYKLSFMDKHNLQLFENWWQGTGEGRWEGVPMGTWATGTVSLHHLRAWQGMHCHFEQEGPPEVTMIELL